MNYLEYFKKWKKFFISNGFYIKWEDESFISFNGLNPMVRVEVYAGNYRTNTETGGCICAELESKFDKISNCPIYYDLTVDEEELYNEILKLVRP